MKICGQSQGYFVYILANRPRGAIYIGVTNDLARRVGEHTAGEGSKHAKFYNIHQLVYFEQYPEIEAAIDREKRLKRWRRAWKQELIEGTNPTWLDLWWDVTENNAPPPHPP